MKKLYIIDLDGFRSHFSELQFDVFEDVNWFYEQVKKDTLARIIPDHDILEAAKRLKIKQQVLSMTSDLSLNEAEDLLRDLLAELELYRVIIEYAKFRFGL